MNLLVLAIAVAFTFVSARDDNKLAVALGIVACCLSVIVIFMGK